MPGPATAYQTGVHASRPANGAGCILYSCTTHGLIYLDNGSSWSTFLTLPSAGGSGTVTTVEEVDGSPTDSAVTKIVFPNGTLGIVSHVATYTPAAGSSILLGCNAYNPGTDAAYATSSATLVDADATNMAVTFTAPGSGNVLVRLTATAEPSTSGASQFNYQSWGIRESTSIIAGPSVVARDMTGNATAWLLSVSAAFKLTGLSAGSHTYKWGFASPAGGGTKLHAGGIFGQAVMEVWSL